MVFVDCLRGQDEKRRILLPTEVKPRLARRPAPNLATVGVLSEPSRMILE